MVRGQGYGGARRHRFGRGSSRSDELGRGGTSPRRSAAIGSGTLSHVTALKTDGALRLAFVIPRFRLAVCWLNPGHPIPSWAIQSALWSISRSESELSVICETSQVPEGVVHSGPWRALLVTGPLDHQLVGVMATIASALAAAGVPVFAISTYQTDWILVPEDRLEAARAALLEAGHEVQP